MDQVYQQILDYLNSEEIKIKVDDILDENFSVSQKENFLKVWQQMKDLEFDVKDWYNFLLFIFHNDIDKAEKIDDELFENVLIDVYEEFQQLYEENKNKKISEIENNKPVSEEVSSSAANQIDLVQKYNSFINSSLFQNILASEEMLTEKFARVGLDLIIKDEFYAAVNAGDKIKAVGVLRVLCKKGKLGSSFQNDKRYLDFWAGFLERHYGVGVKEKFLQNPSEKKYLVEFLRFILEKRLNFNLEESAMIGVGLAELCRESGESEFAEMAYGDEEKGKFMWSE